jgi:DNA-directed RNA polymerase delta subunit
LGIIYIHLDGSFITAKDLYRSLRSEYPFIKIEEIFEYAEQPYTEEAYGSLFKEIKRSLKIIEEG